MIALAPLVITASVLTIILQMFDYTCVRYKEKPTLDSKEKPCQRSA